MQDWYWLVVIADYLITEGLQSTKNKTFNQHLECPSWQPHPYTCMLNFLHTVRHWKCSAGLCTVPSTLSFLNH